MKSYSRYAVHYSSERFSNIETDEKGNPPTAVLQFSLSLSLVHIGNRLKNFFQTCMTSCYCFPISSQNLKLKKMEYV